MRPLPSFATHVLAVAGLTAFYLVTAPDYHGTAIDSYDFAQLMADGSVLGGAPRLFLWHAIMHAAYTGLSWLTPDPFVIAGALNAVLTALAVVLMERHLVRHFGLSRHASWIAAGLFALSYGAWRYATELEVYAAAMLLPLILLHVVFRIGPDSPARPLAGAAVVGALITLTYQPLGIVAGIAVPVYLLLRLGIGRTFLYGAAYGALVAAGLTLIRAVRPVAGTGIDTGGTAPALPGLTDLGHAAVAAGQNVLSVNWAFAFGPTRALIEDRVGHFFFHELVATDPAHWGHLAALATLPAAALLLGTLCALSALSGRHSGPTAAEACVAVWLAVHAAMALLLHPQGFETWLLWIVPAALLFGHRVVRPVAEGGHTALPVVLVAVFAVHNWFAGVGLLAWAERDYNRDVGDPILAEAGPGDLLVVGTSWALERYLAYAGAAPTVLLSRGGPAPVEAQTRATLDAGGTVYLFHEAAAMPPGATWPLDDLATRLSGACGAVSTQDIGDLGHVIAVSDCTD